MIKRDFLWLCSAIIACGSIVFSLTSCSDDDDPDQPQVKELTDEEELRKELLNNDCVDLSDVIFGEDCISLWKLKEDNTFTYYKVNGALTNESADEWKVDSLQGVWNAFVNEDDPWDGEEKLSGFHAIFDVQDSTELGLINNMETYYLAYVQDSIAMTLSKGSVDYAIMTGEVKEAVTRVTTRGLGDFLYNLGRKISQAATAAGNWIINTVGADQSSYNLNEKQSQEFWNDAQKVVKEMQCGYNTNYSEWMGEIYKGRENTRICEMNLPATHDTYTHYMGGAIGTSGTISTYARTQLKGIQDQWASGVRVFDVRLRTTAGNVTTSISEFVGDGLGMFHGAIYCGITAEKGIKYIYDLVRAHPTETAIVICAFEGSAGEKEYALAYHLMNKYHDAIVLNPSPEITLKECAGKMLVMQSWDWGNTYPQYRIGPTVRGGDDQFIMSGTIDYYNLGKDLVQTRLFYQNRYQSGVTNLCTRFWKEKRTLMEGCFEATSLTKGSEANIWAVNQANAYVGGTWLHMSYAKNANTMNPWTLEYVSQHKGEKMGIIMMDYAGTNEKFDGYYTNGADLPKVIVESNRWLK